MKPDGIIFDIKRFALHDGPGIRTTVFLKGCPLNCPWCHNPEGIRPNIEHIISSDVQNLPTKDAGEKMETFGQKKTVAEIMSEIEKDIIFFDQSGGGMTISGGEPLQQPPFLSSILKECKKKKIHTALDTCGYAQPETLLHILSDVDLFLFDLKIFDNSWHQQQTGVSNKLIINNLKMLCLRQKPVFLRFPIIPGITDRPKNISQIIGLIQSLDCIREINLLPFHPTAAQKYTRLNRENPMKGIPPPTQARINEIKAFMSSAGLRQPIHIGG